MVPIGRGWVRALMLLLTLVAVLGMTGCFKAQVIVQLRNAATDAPYHIDKMRVYLELEGGGTVSGLTDANGRVAFQVSEPGAYRVIKVEGLDVTGGDEGDEGREFVKVSPLGSPVPLLVHQFTSYPSATVVNKNDSVEIQCHIPLVRRTTIVRVAHVDTPDETIYSYMVSPSFAGRVVVRNLNCDCSGGLYIRSSGAPENYFVFTLNAVGTVWGMSFYSGSTSTFSIGSMGDIDETLMIEVPGNGDWAVRVGASDYARAGYGGAGTTRNFTSFGCDYNSHALDTYNYGFNNPPPDHYRFDYEFQKFENLL